MWLSHAFVHQVHHLFPQMPHYNLCEATEAVKPLLGPYYREVCVTWCFASMILLEILRRISTRLHLYSFQRTARLVQVESGHFCRCTHARINVRTRNHLHECVDEWSCVHARKLKLLTWVRWRVILCTCTQTQYVILCSVTAKEVWTSALPLDRRNDWVRERLPVCQGPRVCGLLSKQGEEHVMSTLFRADPFWAELVCCVCVCVSTRLQFPMQDEASK